MTLCYLFFFATSVILSGIYAFMWRKRFPVFITCIFIIVPFSNMGYYLLSLAKTIPEAIIGIKISYIGGCYANLFLMYSIFTLCNLNIKKWVRLLLFIITTISYGFVLTIGYSGLFYKEVTGELVNNMLVLHKSYGIVHTLYYVLIVVYMLIMFATTFHAIRKKMDVSKHILRHLLTCEIICVCLFFGGKFFSFKLDLVPLAFLVCQVILLVIIRRIMLYDVTDTAIDAIALNGKTGFVSFDDMFNYLGSNQLAKQVFPELVQLRIDDSALKNKVLKEEIISKILEYLNNNGKHSFFKNYKDQVFQVDINRMVVGQKNRGYILYIQDDTKDQKYISLLNKFNDKLKDEVSEKTAHIVQMHDNLILGMATMVESRDNSTGGHIKRTSDIIKILVEEIAKDGSLTPEFCHNLIKAAPMHDLGKIAVDDAILRKPGRFTDEEYQKMKTHAAEGAHIVHEILKATDDFDFHIIAENVAHYHHERWDGSGYPEGLQGQAIPLEARIMAVADVYDALVSKRVYKEAMTFEQADQIMMESFGKHFDPMLKKYYVAARAQLQEYYSNSQ